MLTLQKSLVRPHVEQCTAAWPPYYVEDKEMTENKSNIGLPLWYPKCLKSTVKLFCCCKNCNEFKSVFWRYLCAGRLVFDNLKKTVLYTITHTLPELFPFMLYLVINIPLATGTIALLFIDIITDIIPAINLAYETPENDIMNRKPRDQQKECLVDSRWGHLLRYSSQRSRSAASWGSWYRISLCINCTQSWLAS